MNYTLFGVDLFGNPIEPDGACRLAEKFIMPPFSVLDARQGFWQERKRAWLALGIRGELGRGENLAAMGGQSNGAKRSNGGGNVIACPGHHAFPACDYAHQERGAGNGRPIPGK